MFKMINHNEYGLLYDVLKLCFRAVARSSEKVERKLPKQRKNTECELEGLIQRFQRRNHREIGKLQGRLEKVSLTWVLMEKDWNKSIKTPKNRLRRRRNSCKCVWRSRDDPPRAKMVKKIDYLTKKSLQYVIGKNLMENMCLLYVRLLIEGNKARPVIDYSSSITSLNSR